MFEGSNKVLEVTCNCWWEHRDSRKDGRSLQEYPSQFIFGLIQSQIL